jgi:hypothetical protein
MGTVLHIGPDRIVTLDEYNKFAEIKKCDRTPEVHVGCQTPQDGMTAVVEAAVMSYFLPFGLHWSEFPLFTRTGGSPESG